MSIIKKLEQTLIDSKFDEKSPWKIRVIQNDECISYLAWNEASKEMLLVDPKREDEKSYDELILDLKNYRMLAVIDTHTHADHISCASKMSEKTKSTLVMHVNAPSRKVDLRVSKSCHINTSSDPIIFLNTPGHTHDSITIIWGPFIFCGDTILFGDTGRDDLPTGNPEAHYESLQLIKKHAKNEMIFLPGHDHKGGRTSSWEVQMKQNASLTQPKEQFVIEAAAFAGKSPALLKESLFENFK